MRALLSYAAAAGEIDEARLDALEASLDDAETLLLASNIDARYRDILLARDQQHYLRNLFLTDLNQLIADVENIRVINETIPRDCYRKITLEPVNPTPVSGGTVRR